MKIVLLNPLFISEKYLIELKNMLNSQGHEFSYYLNRTNNSDEIIERTCDAEIVIVDNTKLDCHILSRCKNLKYINVAFTGVDHIDLTYCKENDIIVSNASGYSTDAVAELTIGLILEYLRKITFLNLETRKFHDKSLNIGNELNNITVGLIGYGKIAKRVRELLIPFKCKVLVYNRSLVNDETIEQVSLKELLNRSEIISIHTPLSESTKNMISFDEIETLTTKPYLINTARGPIVNKEALIYALKNKLISGAALDVYEKEPPLDKDDDLIKFDNVILLPHVGYFTEEAMIKRFGIIKDNLIYFLNGQIKNRVI